MSSQVVKPGATAVYVAHVFVAAALATAGFMLMTAPELGPMAPLVIAQALYVGAFALAVELGLAARAVAVAAAKAIQRRSRVEAQEA